MHPTIGMGAEITIAAMRAEGGLSGTGRARRGVMGGARRFEDLVVWQLAVELRDTVYRATSDGAASKDFKFRDQVRDAASSAPRNIAEGFARYAPPEFAQFMKIVRGSLAETQNHLLHGKQLGYFPEERFNEAWRLSCRALRAASRLHTYLRSCPPPTPRRKTP